MDNLNLTTTLTDQEKGALLKKVLDLEDAHKFIDDFAADADKLAAIAGKPELVDAWRVLSDAGETNLVNRLDDINYIDNYVKNHPNLTHADVKNAIDNAGGFSKWKLAKAVDDVLLPSLKTKFAGKTNLLSWVDDIADNSLLIKLDELTPTDFNKLDIDLSHNVYGPEIKALLTESPDDLTNIWKKLKDDPAFHWEILDDGAGFAAGSRWEKWSQREFFKFVTKKGKDFENLVTGIAKNGSEPPFSGWLNDGFTHHGQLHIENLTGGKRIIGDDVFIKNDIDDLGVSFKRAIYHDSKLSSGSPWTPNQRSELIDIFSNNPNKNYIEFEVRSNLPAGGIVSQGDKVRVYREDVFKTISDGNGNLGSTNSVF